MLFTSFEFLMFFLPIVILVNLLCFPRKLQNVWLLIVSVFFYAWGEPSFVAIILFSIVINYIVAILIDRSREQASLKKAWLILDIIFNLGVLFIFKYLNYTTSILHHFISGIDVTEIVLPIGISFYTFQALSYVVDVYRGEKAQKNIINVGLYISLFPQLIAGPIVRYGDIKEQLVSRKLTLDKFSDGLIRFLIGFNKKMLIANMVAIVADRAFELDGQRTVLFAWMGAICYTLQIYFDFSGYSDMAIGLGKMMGFELPKNFDYPYTSKSLTEFWRRWHISLGQWFRDYLYFPLGGSRVSSKKRLSFNLMFVWLMTGIWHGANMTFFFWGIMNGVLVTLEKLFSIPQKMEKKVFSQNAYRFFTLIAVVIGWVIFRSDSIIDSLRYILDMFGLRKGGLIAEGDVFYLREYWMFILAGIVLSTPIIKKCIEKIEGKNVEIDKIMDALVVLSVWYCLL